MRFTISLISSFKINKVNPFRTLTAPFPLNFLPNLCTTFRVRLLTSSGKLSLAKEIAKFVSVFFLGKLPNQEAKVPPDSIILDI